MPRQEYLLLLIEVYTVDEIAYMLCVSEHVIVNKTPAIYKGLKPLEKRILYLTRTQDEFYQNNRHKLPVNVTVDDGRERWLKKELCQRLQQRDWSTVERALKKMTKKCLLTYNTVGQKEVNIFPDMAFIRLWRDKRQWVLVDVHRTLPNQ